MAEGPVEGKTGGGQELTLQDAGLPGLGTPRLGTCHTVLGPKVAGPSSAFISPFRLNSLVFSSSSHMVLTLGPTAPLGSADSGHHRPGPSDRI